MMVVDTNLSKVGERVHRYLYHPPTARTGTRKFVDRLLDAIPETVVFGGMIRDFGFYSARHFNSDIDLVSMASRNEILSLIRPFNPQINKFGGFRFAVDKQLFDIWSFEDTWAFKEGLVRGKTFEDLCSTTFFNIDAVCQPIDRKIIIGQNLYCATLKNKILDINLEENPAPAKIAARAIRMAITYDLRLSTRLQSYILKHAHIESEDGGPYRTFLRLIRSHQNNYGTNTYFRFCPQPALF